MGGQAVDAQAASDGDRFEHTVEDAAAIANGFRVFYGMIEIGLLIGAIFRRELLLPAIVFGVTLLFWQRSISRAPKVPWVLSVTAGAITVTQGDERRGVQRAEATQVKFVRRHTRYASWWQLTVLGPRKRRVFREGVRDDHRQPVEASLRRHGWPLLSDRRRRRWPATRRGACRSTR